MNRRIDALQVAELLSSVRPDRGNKYASRTVRTKGGAAFEQWQITCRVFGYELCVREKLISEAEFYEKCGCHPRRPGE